MAPAASSTRKREATRERLLDAARLVLAETGIQGATVETISERAGFTRGAFYSNFASRDDLVLALFHRESDRMVEQMDQAFAAEAWGDEDAATIVSGILDRFLVGYPHDRIAFLIQQEFITHGARHPQIATAYREVWERTTDEITHFVQRGVDELGLRLTVPARSVALLLLGTFELAVRTHFLQAHDEPFDAELLHTVVGDLLVAVLDAPVAS